MAKKELALIIHNVRSCYNVGSMLRTAEGLGIDCVYISGYSPYPRFKDDQRLPHVTDKIEKQIDKTALGAQRHLNWSHQENVAKLVISLKADGFAITALEQAQDAKNIREFSPSDKQALLVGNEVEGVDKQTLSLCDNAIEIPMAGKKESFNVSVASAIALYEVANKHKML